jgi:predicted nucleic acid-binding protein
MSTLPPVPGPGTSGQAGVASLSRNDLVVDAGVAIKWYVPEVHEAEAKRLLDPAYTLHVPELFFPEFGNIVWKKARLLKVPEITVDEGRDILRLVLGVDLKVHPMAPLLEPAYDIAVGPEGATVYDCCYLVLAKLLGCRLVTADRAFHDALKAGPPGGHLLWVADPL